MISEKFEELYKKLNSQQKDAVDSIEGPVMVIAGPGTGKTQILTLRIANILNKTDVDPENILALTFTESGVASMRKRLTEIIGSPAYSVNINTFHGFCNSIIKNYPESFSHIVGSQSITEVDQIKILEDLISNLPLTKLRPFGDTFLYIRDILSAINNLKREGIDGDLFFKINAKDAESFEKIEDLYYDKGAHKGKMKGKYIDLKKNIEKNKDLALIYIEYQKQLKTKKLYDYSDMIMEVLKIFSEDKELLLILQEKYRYFLVDEHQDTNNAQNKILEFLCGFNNNPNIFIVGDEKQAIFRFQGASIQNFLFFKNIYPDAKLITLEENYRSTQAILDSAHSLLTSPKSLRANVKHREIKNIVYGFSKPEIEYYFLVKDIEEKIRSGVEPQEIAVLFRDNKDSGPVIEMFQRFSIPFSLESDQNILADRDIKKIVLLLKTINNFGAPDLFLESLHIDFLGIDPLDIYKLIDHSNKNKISVFEVVKNIDVLNSLRLETGQKINEYFKKLSALSVTAKNKNAIEAFEEISRESGFLAFVLSSKDALEKMERLTGFFDEIKSFNESHKDALIGDFLDYLDVLKEHNILIKKNIISHIGKRVRLMTAHKSKGLEFEYVYIINVFDGHWGNRSQKKKLPLPPRIFSLMNKELEEGDENSDERRLFYVALTRAKKGVAITYAKSNLQGRDQLISVFLQEMKADLLQDGKIEDYEKEFLDKKDIIFIPKKDLSINIKDKDFIKEVFERNGLSVSALNNYLKCPWTYFYSNLLRIPQASTKHQFYGIAVHEALKAFFDTIKDGKDPSKDLLINKFIEVLDKQMISKNDHLETKEKGIKALSGYFDSFNGVFNKNLMSELSIPSVILDGIRLVGKLDKVEILDDKNNVNVVDYKTGKAKSRNVIEGATKDADGNYKRQLVFYNLLLNGYLNGKYKMASGEIDFIEPDEKGRYKREIFVINKDEIKELEELIKKVVNEIMTLSFWDRRCEDKKCEFCQLRDLM